MADTKVRLGVLLFPGFELLDVCGPLEMLGNVRDRIEIVMVGPQRGPVASTQGPRLDADRSIKDPDEFDMILVPGGFGTRSGVDDPALIEWVRSRSERATKTLTVCTGTALLARTGLLDGRRATTNKRAFHWVMEQGPKVQWIKKARWVEDGPFWTAAGVSAGMDMALALVRATWGAEIADQIANGAEYEWHRDAEWDPFAALNDLSDEVSDDSPPTRG